MQAIQVLRCTGNGGRVVTAPLSLLRRERSISRLHSRYVPYQPGNGDAVTYHSSQATMATTTGRNRTKKGKTSKSSPSSARWMQRQNKDPYVRKARECNSPSRSIFKLEQIDQMVVKAFTGKNNSKKRNEKQLAQSSKLGLFQPGDTVVELGVCIFD